MPKAAGLIAPLFTLFLAISALCINIEIKTIGNYISKVESHLVLPSGLGWETNLRHMGYYIWYVGFSEVSFWTVIVLANILVAFYYWKKHK
jgi:hypothetical protein